MVMPVVIFLACFGGAVVAAARWLPDLALGSVGGLAFFVVAGLIGAAAGVFGLDIYTIAHTLEYADSHGPLMKGSVLATGFVNILRDSGTLIGLAGIVYLLAPAPETKLAEPA
jgi:hypothetical protein